MSKLLSEARASSEARLLLDTLEALGYQSVFCVVGGSLIISLARQGDLSSARLFGCRVRRGRDGRNLAAGDLKRAFPVQNIEQILAREVASPPFQ